MSAGMLPNAEEPRPTKDMTMLAPKFREAVEAAIAECDSLGMDAMVFETYRSPELQALYYERGRTVRPPNRPVTNAKSNLYSWHGYGLAVDVIHRTKHWKAGEPWFAAVADVFKRHGCEWGGDWRQQDLPHFQWGKCKASPSDVAREIYQDAGMRGVWQEVGAS